MKSKKILILSMAYYPKHIGGAEVAIKEITDRINPEEYEFHLITNRYDSTLLKQEKIGNVQVHRIGLVATEPTMADLRKLPLHLNKLLYQWSAFWKARQLHKKEKFDGVWAMMAHATGVPAGKFKNAFPDVKYVLTLQEGDPLEYIEKKMRIFGKAFDDAFIQADVIQSISSFLAGWAKQMGFVGPNVVVPNAVDTKRFNVNFSPEELAATRDEFGFVSTDVVLVTTSRLVHKNATDDVIQALTDLPENVKFLVFGLGPDKEKLEVLIRKNDLQNRVILQGWVDHKDLPRYLKACDVFIRPSRSEGMGNSFIEAMAAGLPVIATQEGGISDFLFDEKRNPDQTTTGWAVSPDSPQEIVAAVRDIIGRPEKVSEVTEYAFAMVREKYDWNLVAQSMRDEVFDPLFKQPT